jgi:D-alanyl-D-alanine dipeptidase
VAPGVRVDLRYAGKRNVIGRAFYPSNARALLRRPLALRLRPVVRFLRKRGLALLVWDAYRPPAAQRVLWKHTPNPKLVAPPWRGSIHTRGAALDVTLARAKDGRPLVMPTPYDSSSARARRGARRGVSRRARRNSALLARAMRVGGFVPYRAEWWHFNAIDFKRYPLATVSIAPTARPAHGP